MHLLIFVTLLSLLTLTFSNPIMPTQPHASYSIPTLTGSLASKPSLSFHHPSYIQRPHPYPTTLLSKTYPTHHHTESGHHTESYHHTESHTNTHTEPHTHTRPTGTYQHSVIAKPTSTPTVYARDDAALLDPECHPMCWPKGCFCIGDESEAATLSSRDEVAVEARDISTLSDDELAAALNARDELAASLQVRDGTATDGQCNWVCFATSCECINAAGKSFAVSKILAALVLFVAAASAAVGIF